ncbi:MAG: signal peptidase I [Candidatus Levybacteria bacterium CG10_big_fil_rev_8_21_14_0_10_36_7]|nr:MAG: signal peptidase I [Candidatus Levybacteria bacterium CG10_big_fil_rev_8_21_14_0_10_36_7]
MPILRKIYSILVDLIETLVVAGAIFVVIYYFLFRPYQVNGESMFPTYHDGEYILTNLITLKIDDPKRGDVIVFQSPTNNEKDFIKRIIGQPGDTVKLQDGKVYVNDQELDESVYLSSDVRTYGGSFLADGTQVTVPTDNYFVLGDNRNFSSDSREWGFVSKGELIGKSLVVYWPISAFHVIRNVDYSLGF